MRRAFERDYSAARSDQACEIGGYEAGAGTDVDDRLAGADARAPERFENAPAPYPVLQSKTLDLIVACAEHIIAVVHAGMLEVLAERASKNLRAKRIGRDIIRAPSLQPLRTECTVDCQDTRRPKARSGAKSLRSGLTPSASK